MIRIKNIASLVDKDASLIDIGTDHAYLPIYLYLNNITHNIVASDISENALEYAYINLKKYNLEKEIKLVLSDGFKNIKDNYDIGVISGMGTESIIKILDNKNNCKKLIISSHKDVNKLREYMYLSGYKIIKEISFKENNIFYDVIKYEKGIDNLSKKDILIGRSNNPLYIEYIINKYRDIYKKSKNKKYLEYIDIIERKQD